MCFWVIYQATLVFCHLQPEFNAENWYSSFRSWCVGYETSTLIYNDYILSNQRPAVGFVPAFCYQLWTAVKKWHGHLSQYLFPTYWTSLYYSVQLGLNCDSIKACNLYSSRCIKNWIKSDLIKLSQLYSASSNCTGLLFCMFGLKSVQSQWLTIMLMQHKATAMQHEETSRQRHSLSLFVSQQECDVMATWVVLLTLLPPLSVTVWRQRWETTQG